jgi:hypothetical protein
MSTSPNIRQAIEILRFLLTVDDREIINSTIEAVIEMLDEEIEEV